MKKMKKKGPHNCEYTENTEKRYKDKKKLLCLSVYSVGSKKKGGKA